jgi:hypothetical protein
MAKLKAAYETLRALLAKLAGKRIRLVTAVCLAVLLIANAPWVMKGTLAREVFFLFSALAGGFLMMAVGESPRTVEAEKFVLKDDGGKAGAVLAMTPSGPSLSFFDAEGKRRMTMGLGSNGPAVVLFDAHGKSQSWLYSTKDLGGLVVQGGPAEPRMELRASAAGTNLTLFDEKGEGRVRLSLQGTEPVLRVRDAEGKARLAIGVDELGPLLALYDANEKRRAGLAATADGPTLGFYDEEGKLRAGMAANPSGPVLAFLDSDEKVIFSAP